MERNNGSGNQSFIGGNSPFTNSLIEASIGFLVIIKEMVELRRSILVFHI